VINSKLITIISVVAEKKQEKEINIWKGYFCVIIFTFIINKPLNNHHQIPSPTTMKIINFLLYLLYLYLYKIIISLFTYYESIYTIV
jgi:hypothetical protein